MNMKLVAFILVNLIICAIAETASNTASSTTVQPKASTTTPSPITTTTQANFLASTLLNIRNFFFNPVTTTIKPTIDKRVNDQKPASSKNLNAIEVSIKPLRENVTATVKRNSEVKKVEDLLSCPIEKQAQYQLFPTLCKNNEECSHLGEDHRCCKLFGNKRCHEGMPKPLEEKFHEPLFGVQRKCPSNPLTETFWKIQTCNIDNDCDFPRICCPSGRKRYCMNSQLEPEALPVARQLAYPVESFSQYFQCTAAPPPAFDRHPKPCNNTLDCLPNMCCFESGNKYCRPPKKSILSALTTFSQRFNVGIIKDFTDNLVIRKR